MSRRTGARATSTAVTSWWAPGRQFVGPDYQAWDISPRKGFRLYKESKVQLQADFFNAFNQTNFNNPVTNISSSGFGVITGAAPPRQVRLAVKVLLSVQDSPRRGCARTNRGRPAMGRDRRALSGCGAFSCEP
jgi:hypothetical protein